MKKPLLIALILLSSCGNGYKTTFVIKSIHGLAIDSVKAIYGNSGVFMGVTAQVKNTGNMILKPIISVDYLDVNHNKTSDLKQKPVLKPGDIAFFKSNMVFAATELPYKVILTASN